jgi:hypothetical protein
MGVEGKVAAEASAAALGEMDRENLRRAGWLTRRSLPHTRWHGVEGVASFCPSTNHVLLLS